MAISTSFELSPVYDCRTNRQLRSGIDDEALVQLVIALRDEDRLCIVSEEEIDQEPQIICSMGLFNQENYES